MQDSDETEKSSNDEYGSLSPVSDDCDEGLVEVLESVPERKRAQLLQLIEASESHSGWLPTPKFLAEYEAVLPGLAERIVALPEREQAHRHRVIEKVVSDDRDLKGRGQNFAMASLVLLLAVSVLLIYMGEYAWGARIAIFGIAGVVGIFVTGKVADVKVAKSDKLSKGDSEG